MDLSVIIPTRARPQKLAACIGCLQRQDLDSARFEVLVGIDGPDDGETLAIARNASGALRASIFEYPRCGYTAVRNRLIEHARGRILLSLNDDVLAEPPLCRLHIEAHRAREGAGLGPATVVGDSPWVRLRGEDDTLLDRLVRETSMIFFHDQMPGSHAWRERHGVDAASDPERDWGFRHAFGLNVSYPLDRVREAGCFTVYPEKYGYEDIEIAFRLHARFGMPVLFRPAARVWHDHHQSTQGYLAREHALGLAAWGFARMSPDCARATFGRDITAPAEVEYSRQFVEREAGAAARVRETFASLATTPAATLPPSGDSPAARTLIDAIYQQHLLLKRWQWRRGFLEASGSEPGRGPQSAG
ncbi:MAG: glycosyltransferase [Phycisphaeraceae bacterium]|nr:glycosyltransferase [Phycisphaeraceae bacterium]